MRYHWGRFSPRLLERDINAIGDLYHANGFREAKVTSTQNDDYKGKHGNLSLLLEINEGPQWLVHSLVIDGVRTEEDSLLPVHPAFDSRRAVQRVQHRRRPRHDSQLLLQQRLRECGLRLDPDAGSAADAGGSALRGAAGQAGVRAQHLRARAAPDQAKPGGRRITLAPRSPISQARIGESQQKLYDLGIFSKVQTALQNPDGDEDSKNVLFQLDEASKYSFNVGFGAELARIGGGVTTFDAPAGTTAFSPRVTAGISRLNFLGLAHTISLQSLVSTIEQRVSLTYQAAQFYGHENLTLTFSGLFDDSHDIRTFVAHRLEGSVQLAQKLSRVYTIQYRYTIRRVTVPQERSGFRRFWSRFSPSRTAPAWSRCLSFRIAGTIRSTPIAAT